MLSFNAQKVRWARSKRVYDIITGDESWFYYYHPETKRQSQVWLARNNPLPTKVRRQRSLSNTYVCNFLYEVLFLIQSFLLKTIKQLQLSGIQKNVSNVLKQVEKKYRHLNDLIIHHDNASSHEATQTMEYFEAQHIKLMGHPAYSSDLSPCNFWLFPKIKEQLRGKTFQDSNELDAAVEEQMEGLRKEDFYHCVKHWLERMNKCISVQGHYFEQT